MQTPPTKSCICTYTLRQRAILDRDLSYQMGLQAWQDSFLVSQHKPSVCSYMLPHSKKYKEKEHRQHLENQGDRIVSSAFINLALRCPFLPKHMILLETDDHHFFPYLKKKKINIYSLQNTGMGNGEKKKKKITQILPIKDNHYEIFIRFPMSIFYGFNL